MGNTKKRPVFNDVTHVTYVTHIYYIFKSIVINRYAIRGTNTPLLEVLESMGNMGNMGNIF